MTDKWFNKEAKLSYNPSWTPLIASLIILWFHSHVDNAATTLICTFKN